MEWTLTSQLKYSFPIRWRALGRLVCFLTNRIVLFRSFESRILKMLSFFYYFLPTLSGNQSLVTWLISVREEPSFFNFFPDFVIRMWAVDIWKQNLSFFSFHLVLSLLGSQFCLGCCYLKAEPFLFFHLALPLLGSQSYLGCCYLKAEPFPFFIWFCLSWGVASF